MTGAAGTSLKNVTAVVSMLHEAPDPQPNSATRWFRGAPVLRWTLDRIQRARRIDTVAVVCWEDQLPSVVPVAGEERAYVLAKGPRVPLPEVETAAVARRWSDGWRGGLLSTCSFDAGFHGPWCHEVTQRLSSGAAVLVDPSAGLVDPVLLDRLVEHAQDRPQSELCFCPVPPGLGAALLRPALLERLAAARSHPGRLLHYLPDQLSREPLAEEGCVPVATAVARSAGRFTLDSERQIGRIESATLSLNGELMGSDAEEIVRRLQVAAAAPVAVDALPSEVVLELNTVRATRPLFWPGRHHPIDRRPLGVDTAAALFDALRAADDVRLTLGGVGDPMLSDNIFELIDAAAHRDIRSIHVETDLFGLPAAWVSRLARASVDIVSVHVPAVTRETYEAVMGADGYAQVIENIHLFVAARHEAGRKVPLLVPVFTKCVQNLGEMEAWYDQWLRAVGSAVIVGPGTFGGLVPDVAVADMSPPRRSACARLASRLTVLCDGRVVSCEQDAAGTQVMGHVASESLEEIWRRRFAALRTDHVEGRWSKHPVCGACREWHRP